MYYTSRDVYEFISKQTNDPIIERKTCAVSGTEFPIYQSDVDFYSKISPTFAGQKFQIPIPTLCPEERQRRRLSFRNERKLYKRKCDYSGKDIISIYSPDKPYKVYDQKIRRSDNWDPMDYGFEFDFSKMFVEQYQRLTLLVPRISLVNEYTSLVNSDYVNNSMTSKNCYMISGGTDSEDCMYCTTAYYDKECLDCHKVYYSQKCYESLYSYHCYNSNNIINCKNCSNSSYLINCQNCELCHSCTNLINQKFCYQNRQLSQIEYENMLKSNGYYVNTTTPNLYQTSTQTSYGNLITNSNNILLSYDIVDCEQIKYSLGLMNCKDSMDLSIWGDGSSCLYECKEVGVGSINVYFSFSSRSGAYNLLYSQFCTSCQNCFACIGLRNKQYCIFNKQYTKEEYEIQVAKIIQHMMTTGERGEFFHPSLSPFGYNETVAQEYFPINQGELKEFGYKWSNYSSDPKIPETAQVLRPVEMDDMAWAKLIDSDDIIRQVIVCEVSGRPYMIQKAELEFYRKHHLPIPCKHPDIRHEERMKLRPGRTLYLRTCDCCGKEMVSVYDEAYEGKVYCEQCYQKEVFG